MEPSKAASRSTDRASDRRANFVDMTTNFFSEPSSEGRRQAHLQRLRRTPRNMTSRTQPTKVWIRSSTSSHTGGRYGSVRRSQPNRSARVRRVPTMRTHPGRPQEPDSSDEVAPIAQRHLQCPQITEAVNVAPDHPVQIDHDLPNRHHHESPPTTVETAGRRRPCAPHGGGPTAPRGPCAGLRRPAGGTAGSLRAHPYANGSRMRIPPSGSRPRQRATRDSRRPVQRRSTSGLVLHNFRSR